MLFKRYFQSFHCLQGCYSLDLLLIVAFNGLECLQKLCEVIEKHLRKLEQVSQDIDKRLS